MQADRMKRELFEDERDTTLEVFEADLREEIGDVE